MGRQPLFIVTRLIMLARFKTAMQNPDERLMSVNVFALLLASNQLLYAPSLELMIGGQGHYGWPVAATAPAFAATLWISRHSSLAARLWLPLMGIVDTIVAQLALGSNSGVWIFLLPSLTLAGFLLDRRERYFLAALGTVAIAVLLFLPAGRDVLAPDTAIAVARINAGSALILTGFIGWVFGNRKS